MKTRLKTILTMVAIAIGQIFALPALGGKSQGRQKRRLWLLPALSVVCIITLMPAAPAAAGWKEDFLHEFSLIVQDLGKAMEAQGFGDASSPGLVSANGIFAGLSGFCVGIAEESSYPMPKHTIDEILRVNKMILHGKVPETKTLSNIGKLCLDYFESTMRKEGASDVDIEITGETIVKVFIPRLRASMGLPPKQP